MPVVSFFKKTVGDKNLWKHHFWKTFFAFLLMKVNTRISFWQNLEWNVPPPHFGAISVLSPVPLPLSSTQRLKAKKMISCEAFADWCEFRSLYSTSPRSVYHLSFSSNCSKGVTSFIVRMMVRRETGISCQLYRGVHRAALQISTYLYMTVLTSKARGHTTLSELHKPQIYRYIDTYAKHMYVNQCNAKELITIWIITCQLPNSDPKT